MGRKCSKCSEVKTLDDFPRDKSGKDGRRASCKKCEAARRRQIYYANRDKEIERARKYREEHLPQVVASRTKRYEENREREIQRAIEWKKENPERVRANKYNRRKRELAYLCEWDAEKESAVLARFGGGCALSGYIGTDLTLDHFIPLATGKGGTRIENMIPLRADLNFSKNDSNPFEWFERHHERFNISRSRFNSVVEYFAEMNGMTTVEYRDYVYSCFNAIPTENLTSPRKEKVA